MDSIEMWKRLDETFQILIVFFNCISLQLYCFVVKLVGAERQNDIFSGKRVHRNENPYTSIIGMHGQNWQQYKSAEGGKTRSKLCNGCRIMMVKRERDTNT